ncbi:hypothetical protein [Clostridium intestinale]|uniref:hypothetical protein n=1 Tax=Clostridium intestinale TaxID=36845 RepID=UPI002DD62CD8|nr:hypothetical protein [Clostridium intestinale]WRY53232.1 hypothetical protein P8F83_08500 [Clostridium intestinale]
MLINLLKYEFMKKWKSMKYILLGYALIEVILLVTNRILLSRNGNEMLFGDGSITSEKVGFLFLICIIFYFLFILLISIYPFFEGVTRYEKELSGKQAPLELMIPAPSWKKVLSKLISTIVVTIGCSIISLASVMMFILVMSNFDKVVLTQIYNWFKIILDYPFSLLFTIIFVILSYAAFYLLINFCTAVAKAITHKNKLSTFISIITFGVLVAIMTYLSIAIENYPIVTFTFFKGLATGMASSLSSIILDIVILSFFFAGTSYIMEKRIEY